MHILSCGDNRMIAMLFDLHTSSCDELIFTFTLFFLNLDHSMHKLIQTISKEQTINLSLDKHQAV